METGTLGARLIVQRLEEREQKAGGIVIPDAAKEPLQGKVILAGSGKTRQGGRHFAFDVKVGDLISFDKSSGEAITLEGEEYLIMRENEVLSVLNSPSRTGQRRRVPRRRDVTVGQAAFYAIEALTALENARRAGRSGVGTTGGTLQPRFKGLRALISAGLVKPGAKGYQLAKPLSRITVKEIMAALEGPAVSPDRRRRSSWAKKGRGAAKAMSTPDPEEKYTPSRELVTLLKQRSPVLSKKESATLRAQANSTAGSSVKDGDLASLVGERIEGLLGNLARRAAASGQDIVLLADSRRFPPEISAELIDRLDVDLYYAQEFLDELHRDLRAFAAVPRVRSWGRIETDRGKLVLPVAVNRASRPDFSDLFERPWVVTK